MEETKGFTNIRPGMWVKVHQRIKDVNAKGEEKERVQIFEGRVLGRKGGNSQGATLRVYKDSFGIGVERIFPVYLPTIVKIEPIKVARVRRAKLNYLKGKYKKVLREKKVS